MIYHIRYTPPSSAARLVLGTTTVRLSALHTTGNPVSRPATPFPKMACFRLSALGTFPHWVAAARPPFCSYHHQWPSTRRCFRPRRNTTTSDRTITSPLPSLKDVGPTSPPTHRSPPRGWVLHVIGPAASGGTINEGCNSQGRSDVSARPWPGNPGFGLALGRFIHSPRTLS